MYFCTSVYFKASQETIPTDPDKISYNTVGVETGVGNSKTFLAYDYMLLLNYLGSLAVPRKVVSNWMGVLISKERNNVIVLNTKAIVKSSQWKAIFRATTRLPNYFIIYLVYKLQQNRNCEHQIVSCKYTSLCTDINLVNC
jgi:hypothetical protein